jgi:hypothetical protein
MSETNLEAVSTPPPIIELPDGRYQCGAPDCGVIYDYASSIRGHRAVHDKSEHDCQFCGRHVIGFRAHRRHEAICPKNPNRKSPGGASAHNKRDEPAPTTRTLTVDPSGELSHEDILDLLSQIVGETNDIDPLIDVDPFEDPVLIDRIVAWVEETHDLLTILRHPNGSQ